MALSKFKMKKSESILISIVALALNYLFIVYWLKPHKAELVKVLNQAEEMKVKIAENQVALVTLQGKAPSTVEYQTSNELLDKYMKSNDRFSNVIARIVDETKDEGFSVQKISSESSSELHGYSQTLYNIVAESSFIGIGEFLQNLEDSPLLTEVKSIEISRNPNELKVCKASIKLFSYVSGSPGGVLRTPASEKPSGAGKPSDSKSQGTPQSKPEVKS